MSEAWSQGRRAAWGRVRRRWGAEGVDGFAAVCDGGAVKGDADEGGGPAGEEADGAVAHGGEAVEFYFDSFVGAHDFPGVGAGEPVVGAFGLPAVLDQLAEDAVF